MAANGALLDTWAVHGGAGVLILRNKLDVSLHYRRASLVYTAATEAWTEHRVRGEARFAYDATLDFVIALDATSGPDAGALALFATAIWRPRL